MDAPVAALVFTFLAARLLGAAPDSEYGGRREPGGDARRADRVPIRRRVPLTSFRRRFA
jgi:hypothetical protein